jgi:hypothetical protein
VIRCALLELTTLKYARRLFELRNPFPRVSFKMAQNKPYLRVAAFAGVLILVSGLVMGLFTQASAVEMEFTQTPSDGTVTNQETFTVNLEIPNDERVPVDSLKAVVEQQAEDRTSKVNANLVGLAECPMTGQADTGCPSDEDFTQTTAAITDITVSGFFAGQVGDGYSVGYDSAYSYESSRDVSTTGYGYDTSSQVYQDEGYGYGYGYDLGTTSDYSIGSGYGYGYDGDTLIIQIDVTVDGNELTSGDTHYLTVLADTGSSTVGDLSTPFTEFTPQSGGGGFGSGDGGGQGPVQTGLNQAFTVSQNQRVEIIQQDLPPNFRDTLVKFNRACDGCTIGMQTHGGSPPSGTPGLPAGIEVLPSTYFTLEVKDSDGNVVEGAIDDGSIEFEVSKSKLDKKTPQQVVLMHHEDGEWMAEETRLTTATDANPLVYDGTLSSFSVFATATDTQKPSISNPAPTGETTAVTPEISADFSDNRGIDTDSFELWIDGRTANADTGTLDVTEDGFTYVPATQLNESSHDVRAKIADDSGLETERTWSFTVSAEQCPNPPRITNVKPAEGASDVSLDTDIEVTVQQGSCPITSSSLTVNGDSVQATLSDGTLTAALPSDVGNAEEVTATATVSDQADNTAQRSWSFNTQQADTGGGGGGTDGGTDGGGLVWVIVVLVVLAIVGVGAYFYTQEEGGSGGRP